MIGTNKHGGAARPNAGRRRGVGGRCVTTWRGRQAGRGVLGAAVLPSGQLLTPTTDILMFVSYMIASSKLTQTR